MLKEILDWIFGDIDVPHINSKGLELIQRSEGCCLHRYKDTNGAFKIGYGSPAGNLFEITQADASLLLLKTLRPIEKGVYRAIKVPILSDQFSALVSFTYNVGMRDFLNSTALAELNHGNYKKCADLICLYDRVNGFVNQGILERRFRERELFLSSNIPLPPPTLPPKQ